MPLPSGKNAFRASKMQPRSGALSLALSASPQDVEIEDTSFTYQLLLLLFAFILFLFAFILFLFTVCLLLPLLFAFILFLFAVCLLLPRSFLLLGLETTMLHEQVNQKERKEPTENSCCDRWVLSSG